MELEKLHFRLHFRLVLSKLRKNSRFRFSKTGFFDKLKRNNPFGLLLFFLVFRTGIERRLLAACRWYAATAVALPAGKGFPYGSPDLLNIRIFIFSNSSGSTTSILPSPDGRNAKHCNFWRSQKKMRRGTTAAPPPEYSRTVLLSHSVHMQCSLESLTFRGFFMFCVI